MIVFRLLVDDSFLVHVHRYRLLHFLLLGRSGPFPRSSLVRLVRALLVVHFPVGFPIGGARSPFGTPAKTWLRF
eukprot:5355219-Heterocapsa_arctica.AAC.1